MDTHARSAANRRRRNDMMLRLDDKERTALDRVATTREQTRSEAIRTLILEAEARLGRTTSRRPGKRRM